MRVDHVAIWVDDLEKMREFYEKYFRAVAGRKYVNPTKQFESYFMRFDFGARIELMKRPDIPKKKLKPGEEQSGISHLCISVTSVEDVNRMAEIFRRDGFSIIDGPRRTGDGYYECVILDPENNRIEIASLP